LREGSNTNKAAQLKGMQSCIPFNYFINFIRYV